MKTQLEKIYEQQMETNEQTVALLALRDQVVELRRALHRVQVALGDVRDAAGTGICPARDRRAVGAVLRYTQYTLGDMRRLSTHLEGVIERIDA